jgi:protein tyrosine phosphatase (PTP) superfamily phosphohydrolase (DUF442 family)
MYLLKQVKVEKDTIMVGRPKSEDLENLSREGYQRVLDIMPKALKDKGLARRVKAAGMAYTHIPVEICDEENCTIDEAWVVRFARFINLHDEIPMIINTDDETLGVSLVVLSNLMTKGQSLPNILKAIEALGMSLKGRREIKRFLKTYYDHHQRKAIDSKPGIRGTGKLMAGR